MVIGRFFRIFDRFAARHLIVQIRGGSLNDKDSGGKGYLDRIRIEGNRLHVSGWTTASRVTLTAGAARITVRPSLNRQDVADAMGTDPTVGFRLDMPRPPGPVRLILSYGGKDVTRVLRSVSRWRVALARTGLFLRFLGVVAQALPDIWRWQRQADPQARARIKTALGLDPVPTAGPLDSRIFGTAADAPPPDQPITIILPVYNAFDLLPEVLDRVIRHTTLPFRLLVIEDASTDPAVRPFLREWVAAHGDVATLIENEANLGFIASVNSGLGRALDLGGHVVLLNSDAFVPMSWAERLLRPILTQDKVASVTPMSNDAEIFSVPVICKRTVLSAGQGDAIDATAQRLHPDTTLATVPTGVGFCMAINAAFLRLVPQLDLTFGRGYGEEVDWCQRVRALGGRHLGVAGLFVEHRGGESFGSAEKLRLVLANNAVIAARYPRYDGEVQDFISVDPILSPRLALGLAWAGSLPGAAVAVYLGHTLGGGADKDLDRRIAADLAGVGAAVVLRVGGPMRWRLELHSPSGVTAGTTDSFDLIRQLLLALPRRRIVYSCAVGDPDPVELPDLLLSLKSGPQDRIEVLFHDFYPVTPSYCLLDADGVFRGPVTAGRSDAAHRARRLDGGTVPLADWQAAWGRLIAAADEVEVFSHDSRDHVAAAYPGALDRIVVRPHAMLVAVPPIAPPVPQPGSAPAIVVAVLGNIGLQKGAALLVRLARAIDAQAKAGVQPRISLVLIGNIDPAYALPASVKVHGDYRQEDIADLAAAYGVGCWLIPSVWPETFSFTTHEVLATGLPVFCFDIGAQAEAAQRAANGRTIPFAPDGDPAADVLAAIRLEMAQKP